MEGRGWGAIPVIAFGCMVSEPEPYRRYAEQGIRRAREPDSQVYSFASVGTIGRGYNLLLDAAKSCEDLEALVLVHPHTEIADEEFTTQVRAALADPSVGVLGCAGARGVTSIAWWEGEINSGQITQRYTEHGGGDLPAYGWTRSGRPPVEVDAVDGFLLVLSPWAVRNVQFDEGLIYGHGFDLDYCLKVRAAGRKVVTFDAQIVQHRSLDLISDLELWVEAHIAVGRKWNGSLREEPADDAGWKQRARRAEAEREAARAIAYSRRLGHDARVEELQRRIDQATQTLSWRVTRPLREVNLWRRSRRERERA